MPNIIEILRQIEVPQDNKQSYRVRPGNGITFAIQLDIKSQTHILAIMDIYNSNKFFCISLSDGTIAIPKKEDLAASKEFINQVINTQFDEKFTKSLLKALDKQRSPLNQDTVKKEDLDHGKTYTMAKGGDPEFEKTHHTTNAAGLSSLFRCMELERRILGKEGPHLSEEELEEYKQLLIAQQENINEATLKAPAQDFRDNTMNKTVWVRGEEDAGAAPEQPDFHRALRPGILEAALAQDSENTPGAEPSPKTIDALNLAKLLRSEGRE